jgi:hypothetical protein
MKKILISIILTALFSLPYIEDYAISDPIEPSDILSVSDPGQPSGLAVEAGITGTPVGRLQLDATSGTVNVTSLRVANKGSAVYGDDILALSLFDDVDFLGYSYWSPAESRYVFQDLNLQVISSSPRVLSIAMNAAEGPEVGRSFAMEVSSSDITVEDPDIVSMSLPISGNSFTLTGSAVSGSTGQLAPTVVIINPGSSTKVSGSFRLQVQVYNPSGLNSLIAVDLSTDGGSSYYAYSFDLINDLNQNYNVGTNAGIYETVMTLPPGGYTLKVRAVNDESESSTSQGSPVLVNPAGMGDGMLLRRDNSSQLCIDCHALKDHSSQVAGDTYGSWIISCRGCHIPHNTRNIYLVKEEIIPPNYGSYLGRASVFFSSTTGITSTTLIQDATYVNPDNTGPCQVCHTRTAGPGGIPRFRSTGNSDTHFSDPSAPVRCTLCACRSMRRNRQR